MKLSLTTLLHLRSAVIMLLKALDATLIEAYGWTPRGSTASGVTDSETKLSAVQ